MMYVHPTNQTSVLSKCEEFGKVITRKKCIESINSLNHKVLHLILQMIKHLIDHMKTHNNEKPHSCHVCNKVTLN